MQQVKAELIAVANHRIFTQPVKVGWGKTHVLHVARRVGLEVGGVDNPPGILHSVACKQERVLGGAADAHQRPEEAESVRDQGHDVGVRNAVASAFRLLWIHDHGPHVSLSRLIAALATHGAARQPVTSQGEYAFAEDVQDGVRPLSPLDVQEPREPSCPHWQRDLRCQVELLVGYCLDGVMHMERDHRQRVRLANHWR